jgi:hypothetical protein
MFIATKRKEEVKKLRLLKSLKNGEDNSKAMSQYRRQGGVCRSRSSARFEVL